MTDAGFILGSYAITFGSILIFAWRTVRSGKSLSDGISDEEKPWL